MAILEFLKLALFLGIAGGDTRDFCLSGCVAQGG